MKYQMNNQSIDEIAAETEKFLQEIKMEKRNILRIRLAVEDLLLEWQEHFSAQAVCKVKMGTGLGRPFIILELDGEQYNPLDKNLEEYGAYRERLLANMGLAPIYSYERGCNKIIFKFLFPKSRVQNNSSGKGDYIAYKIHWF